MKSFSFRSILPTSIFLLVMGMAGLAVTIFLTLPTLGPRWLFFFFIVNAVTGLMLPVVYFLNLRFPSSPAAVFSQVLREALIIGIYFGVIAWLQMGRVLTLGVGVILAVVAIIVEVLIRLREHSRWKPRT